MPNTDEVTLTQRQERELIYHRERAKEYQALLDEPFSWGRSTATDDALVERVLEDVRSSRWLRPRGKRVLVVGCGFGDDALRLAKLGAQVSAFDLSADSLAIARKLAVREALDITFDEMPAEAMRYDDNVFDCVVARDILHHVDIPLTMAEIVRVAKPDALFVVNEIYSHSITDRVRHSSLVSKFLYPRMRRLIYGERKPYITEDERKLNEADMREIERPLQPRHFEAHFNFLVTRLVPDRHDALAQVDRLLLIVLRPFARFLAGRIIFFGSNFEVMSDWRNS